MPSLASLVAGLLIVARVAAAASPAAIPGFGTKPHIVVLLVDNLGWANVGFHRPPDVPAREISTPNLDKLAAEYLILDRHYTVRRVMPNVAFGLEPMPRWSSARRARLVLCGPVAAAYAALARASPYLFTRSLRRPAHRVRVVSAPALHVLPLPWHRTLTRYPRPNTHCYI